MELREDEEMLECEKKENINKFSKKQLDLTIDDEQIKVFVFNKIQENKKNKENVDDKQKDKKNENIENNQKDNVIIESINKVAEGNDVSDNKYVDMKNNKSKSIAVVMYMQDNAYSTKKEENVNIHIKGASAPSFLAKIIKEIFTKLYEINIVELIMGHEHGEANKKCHLQIIIIFEQMFRKILKPGALKIITHNDIICLLYMQQKTRNTYALKNYCTKERDATIVRKEEIIKFDIREVEDPFEYIKNNYNKITIDEARTRILEYSSIMYFKNSTNFENAMKKIIVEEPPVPFKWMPIPEYLKTFYLPDGESFYDTFNKWYQTYCINGDKLDRKKALCIYSRERAMGKSYFVRHLVSHPDYVLEFNNTICPKKNLNKGIHKLLLLDDMKIISENTKQMWKSLVASEPTTLRGAWVNEEFNERLPCIITTNDIEMIKLFHDDKLFNTQVFVIEINGYMGAPGTQREDLMKNEFVISDKTAELLRKMNLKRAINEDKSL